jgi:hypothetical protein
MHRDLLDPSLGVEVYRFLNRNPAVPSPTKFLSSVALVRTVSDAISLGCHTGNHLAAVATVNSEILVGREDDRIGKRFGHANEASIG